MDHIKRIYRHNKTALIFLGLVFVAFLLWSWSYSSRIIDIDKLGEEVSEMSDFNKEMNLFDRVLRYTWHNIETGDLEGSLSRTEEAYRLWERLDRNHRSNKPEEYKNTKDWQSFMLSVSGRLKSAKELAQKKNLEEAGAEINSVMKLLREVRSQNGINDYSEELLSFYEIADRVSRANKKIEIEPYMPELKIAFTYIKELDLDTSLQKTLIEMEEKIGELDKLLDGPDFKRAQARLLKLFFELYFKY